MYDDGRSSSQTYFECVLVAVAGLHDTVSRLELGRPSVSWKMERLVGWCDWPMPDLGDGIVANRQIGHPDKSRVFPQIRLDPDVSRLPIIHGHRCWAARCECDRSVMSVLSLAD